MSLINMTTPPRPTSTFLTLPLELRHQIYAHLDLPHHQTIDITTHAPIKSRCKNYIRICPEFLNPVPDMFSSDILLTCKQTRREAMDLMYGSNKFVAENADTLYVLERLLLKTVVASIQTLDLTLKGDLWAALLAGEVATSDRLDPAYKSGIKMLSFLIEKMSGLKRLTLCASSDLADDTTQASSALAETTSAAPASGDKQPNQQRQALLRLGGTLLARHPLLDLVVWPADNKDQIQKGPQIQTRIEIYSRRAGRTPVLKSGYKLDDQGRQTDEVLQDVLLDSADLPRMD